MLDEAADARACLARTQRLAAHRHGATCRRKIAGDQLQERRFARAIAPHKPIDIPGRQGQGHIVHRSLSMEDAREVRAIESHRPRRRGFFAFSHGCILSLGTALCPLSYATRLQNLPEKFQESAKI